MVLALWRGWRSQQEGRGDPKRVWPERMKPSGAFFTMVLLPSSPLSVAGWPGTPSLLLRLTYLTSNHATQVMLHEMQSPHVEKWEPCSAAGCCLRNSCFLVAIKCFKKIIPRRPGFIKSVEESCRFLRAVFIYLPQGVSKGMFWMFIHFFTSFVPLTAAQRRNGCVPVMIWWKGQTHRIQRSAEGNGLHAGSENDWALLTFFVAESSVQQVLNAY